jgi:hypothetical protein
MVCSVCLETPADSGTMTCELIPFFRPKKLQPVKAVNTAMGIINDAKALKDMTPLLEKGSKLIK